jgi:hypothetical protein
VLGALVAVNRGGAAVSVSGRLSGRFLSPSETLPCRMRQSGPGKRLSPSASRRYGRPTGRSGWSGGGSGRGSGRSGCLPGRSGKLTGRSGWRSGRSGNLMTSTGSAPTASGCVTTSSGCLPGASGCATGESGCSPGDAPCAKGASGSVTSSCGCVPGQSGDLVRPATLARAMASWISSNQSAPAAMRRSSQVSRRPWASRTPRCVSSRSFQVSSLWL